MHSEWPSSRGTDVSFITAIKLPVTTSTSAAMCNKYAGDKRIWIKVPSGDVNPDPAAAGGGEEIEDGYTLSERRKKAST